jgi:hypothetical protein
VKEKNLGSANHARQGIQQGVGRAIALIIYQLVNMVL